MYIRVSQNVQTVIRPIFFIFFLYLHPAQVPSKFKYIIVYMNDYEILFHACTTNYSSLAWKIKSWENSAQYALHCAVSVCTLLTLFVKIAI